MSVLLWVHQNASSAVLLLALPPLPAPAVWARAHPCRIRLAHRELISKLPCSVARLLPNRPTWTDSALCCSKSAAALTRRKPTCNSKGSSTPNRHATSHHRLHSRRLCRPPRHSRRLQRTAVAHLHLHLLCLRRSPRIQILLYRPYLLLHLPPLLLRLRLWPQRQLQRLLHLRRSLLHPRSIPTPWVRTVHHHIQSCDPQLQFWPAAPLIRHRSRHRHSLRLTW